MSGWWYEVGLEDSMLHATLQINRMANGGDLDGQDTWWRRSMRESFAVLLLLAVCWANDVAAASAEECISDGDQIEFVGTVWKETFPGPPEYENIENGDRAETYWFLAVERSICFYAFDPEAQDFYEIDQPLSTFQLVLDRHQYDMLRAVKFDRVRVKGDIFSGVSGHHHSAALIDVSELVEANESSGSQIALHDRLITFFIGACLQALPDIERIKAAARVKGWKPLEGDVAAMAAPAARDAIWQGWFVRDGSDAFLIGVSEGNTARDNAVSCSVSVREVDQEKLVTSLRDTLAMTNISDETEALQRYQAWETEVNGEPLVIHLTSYAKEAFSPVTLTGVGWD